MPDSLAKYDPDTCLWRTSQACLFEGWTEFSETFPASGMMRSGELYPQPMSEPPTSASGSGSWPTPRHADYKGATNPSKITAERVANGKANLPEAMQERERWPTPQSRDYKGARLDGKTSAGSQTNLNDAVRQEWATPSAADAVGSTGGGQGRSLRTDIHNWKKEEMLPTPRSRDWKDTGDPAKLAALIDKGHQETLPRVIAKQQVKLWPTPCAQSKGHYSGDIQDWGGSGNPLRDKSLRESRGVNGALNPTWVEWLMGYPLGWTVLKDSETP